MGVDESELFFLVVGVRQLLLVVCGGDVAKATTHPRRRGHHGDTWTTPTRPSLTQLGARHVPRRLGDLLPVLRRRRSTFSPDASCNTTQSSTEWYPFKNSIQVCSSSSLFFSFVMRLLVGPEIRNLRNHTISSMKSRHQHLVQGTKVITQSKRHLHHQQTIALLCFPPTLITHKPTFGRHSVPQRTVFPWSTARWYRRCQGPPPLPGNKVSWEITPFFVSSGS